MTVKNERLMSIVGLLEVVTKNYLLQEIEFPTAGLESVPGSFHLPCDFTLSLFFWVQYSSHQLILLYNSYVRWWGRRNRNDWKYAIDSWILWPLHKSRKSHTHQNSKLLGLEQYYPPLPLLICLWEDKMLETLVHHEGFCVICGESMPDFILKIS